MQWSKTLSMVQAHCEGEVGNVVTSGILSIPGQTMADKMNYINHVDDSLRRFLVFEPRACVQMSTNVLLPPTRPEADAAFLILQADRAHAMSGSNSVCVVTTLLETGILPMLEPETKVVLDTPAGLVTATASCNNGKCERVRLEMVPSFVEELDVPVRLNDGSTIKVDIAYGGCYYALVDSDSLGLELNPANARKIVAIGAEVKKYLNDHYQVQHPEFPAINEISYSMLVGRDKKQPELLRGATVLLPGRLDRSPCGTGNSARMAVMAERGEVSVGDVVKARSVIDSEFEITYLRDTEVAGRKAIVPQVSGRGWIHGFNQIGLDPSDPYPLGYALSDTWGEDIAQFL